MDSLQRKRVCDANYNTAETRFLSFGYFKMYEYAGRAGDTVYNPALIL